MEQSRVVLDRKPALTPIQLTQFQSFSESHPETHRTLRMDQGGVCHRCGRKAGRRVEMHTPLWPSGPIMYGECCLEEAYASLQAPPAASFLAARRPASAFSALRLSTLRLSSFTASDPARLTLAAVAGLSALAVGMECLLHLA